MTSLEKVPAAYMLLNPETTEYYVGSTTNLRRRINEHRIELERGIHHSWKLQRAYGKNPNFELHAILTPTREDAQSLEQRIIDESWGDGSILNIAKDTTCFRLGCKDSDETRLRKSLSKKNIPQSPELVEKRAAANRGQTRTQETCDKIGLSKKGNKYWEGKEHTEESKQKISAARKKPVVINGEIYPSISEAAQHFELSIASTHWRVANPTPKWAGWNYVSAEKS